MSDPYLAPQPPAAPARPSRAPWVVAVLAAVVALAAVIALVVVIAGDDGDGEADDSPRLGAGDSDERGFESPEEAVRFMVESLAEGEAEEAAEAFAVESVVEGYSYEAQAERLSAVMYNTWLPGSSDGYDEINTEVRRGEVAVELRSLVRSVLTPDRDQTVTTTLDDDLTAADLADELSPEPLSELSVARIDEIDRADEAYLATLEQQGAVYAADELRMVAMLLDTAEGQVMGGATAVRYGDQWALMSLSAPLLNIPFAQLEPVSEQDYLDAVESARGTD